jgi:hypothetical protein
MHIGGDIFETRQGVVEVSTVEDSPVAVLSNNRCTEVVDFVVQLHECHLPLGAVRSISEFHDLLVEARDLLCVVSRKAVVESFLEQLVIFLPGFEWEDPGVAIRSVEQILEEEKGEKEEKQEKQEKQEERPLTH